MSVLYSDPSSYEIKYFCRNLDDNKSVDVLWIFARTPQMDAETLKEARAKVAEYFKVEKLHTIKHDETCGDYLN